MGYHGFHGAHLLDVNIITTTNVSVNMSNEQLNFKTVAIKLEEVCRKLDVIKAFHTYRVPLR